ncbi:class I SAM-dependent methyltransferase [Paenibacillus ferrarius]|uniref:methyltransferase domain-containing protein n=1 Tax=Paenibacillus ferrarius TaxID=1469647 RepID=UPI0009A497C3
MFKILKEFKKSRVSYNETYPQRDYSPTNAKILEVGCGTGAYSLHFAEQQHEVVAVDITPKHIEKDDYRQRKWIPFFATTGMLVCSLHSRFPLQHGGFMNLLLFHHTCLF